MFEKSLKINFKWGTAIVICLAVFIVILNVSVLNVAISTLMHDLKISLGSIRTMIAFYTLIIASFMITTSKIQDVIGRKKTFLIGLTIFGTGSIVSTLSINYEMLFLGWAVLQGLGAALIFPVTTSILEDSYENQDQVTALGLWGGVSSMGSALGPIIGGFFTSFISWRSIFIFEFFIVILLFLFAFLIKNSKGYLNWKDFDYKGAILSIISLLLIVVGILLFNYPKFWNYAIVLLIAGLIIFIIFLLYQSNRIKKGLKPISDIRLFKKKIFTVGNINFILRQIPLAGFLFFTPVFLQKILNLSAFDTGLVLLPSSIIIMIFALLGSKIAEYISTKYLLISGYFIASFGSYLLGQTFFIGTNIISIILATIIFGVGMGLLASELTEIIMASASKNQNTDASGILNSLKNLGYSLGTVLIGIIFLFTFVGAITGSIQSENHINDIQTKQISENIFNSLDGINLNSTNISLIAPEISMDKINSSINYAIESIFNFLAIILAFAGILTFLFVKREIL